jgi:hypothetical protein
MALFSINLPRLEFRQRVPLKVDVVGLLVAVGLAVRLLHYCSNYTIWYDESVLLFNIVDKGFSRLLGPLDYEVAAPPLFLWTLKTIGCVFPDNAYVWRFLPFLASCGTLVLTSLLARRVLAPTAAAIVTALVAFSDAHLWLGCCVKPYILDACLATGFLYAFALTAEWPAQRRLALFAAVAPFYMCLSYPALFLYGCLIMASLPTAWRHPGWKSKAAWGALGIVVVANFAVLYFGPIKAQRVSGLVAGWGAHFPNLQRPWFVPLWSIGNTYTVFHYLYNPSGALALVLSVTGARVCWRRRQFDWLILLAGPLFAAYLASFAHAYPYSNNRLMLFAAPGIAVLMGLGIDPCLTWLRARRAWAPAAFVVILLAPVIGFSTFHIARPWNQPDSSGTALAIKTERQPGDLVRSDEGTYSYFFYGEIKPFASLEHTTYPAGTRLWAAMDHYQTDQRHQYVRFHVAEAEWDLVREDVRYRSSLFLFVHK